jgi:hypothetical protein
VLTKAFVGKLDEGIGPLFRSWQPYALVVVGIATLVVSQSAYQDNHPTLALPVMNVGDPLIGVVLGLALFDEHLSLSGARPLLLFAAVATTVAGVVALTRAPRVLEAEAPPTAARLAT